jgi:two-component system, OmpR family, sensor histidine kinase BaeS
MKAKLSYKIFLAFLLTSIMIVVLMTAIMGYFARRNFEDFVNKMEMGRLDELITELSDFYQAHQGWESLRGDPGIFHEMMKPEPPGHSPQGPPVMAERPEPPDGYHPGPKEMPRPPGPDMESRLSLYDAGMRLITGRSVAKGDQILKDIVIEGKVVGRLGLQKRKGFQGPLEAGFIYRQSSAFLTVGFAALILAALVSYVFSRHLLTPVEQLAGAAHALAMRKFDTRVVSRANDELGQLAEDFNTMANTLGQYENMRRQWISDISHELRTPIAILRGEIEAIQDGIHEAGKETMQSIHAEIMLLNSLVNDLHELSMADTGNLSMNLEQVHVLKVLQDVMKMNESRFSQAGISMESDPSLCADIVLSADKDRLFQLFSNILENTLRYTESPGRLKVWQQSTLTQVNINFEDSKPGIPDSSLERIFDRLYRVDQSRSRKEGGSGLGLAICRSIVELLGGGIRAYHSSLGGLRIEVILPLTKNI